MTLETNRPTTKTGRTQDTVHKYINLTTTFFYIIITIYVGITYFYFSETFPTDFYV